MTFKSKPFSKVTPHLSTQIERFRRRNTRLSAWPLFVANDCVRTLRENIVISLSWKNLSGDNPSRLGTLWLLALALITSNASAGDKIVFSDDKPKSANPADIKPANELFRSWNTKLETPNFDYSILGIPTIPRATLDRKRSNRRRGPLQRRVMRPAASPTARRLR